MVSWNHETTHDIGCHFGVGFATGDPAVRGVAVQHRMHGVLLVAQGMTCPEVARLLGDAPRSVENWVHRVDQQGLAGLTEGSDPDAPAEWTKSR